MIHMPHRSVTRFFIPLIDVLLLLFCIFLLMPYVESEESLQTAELAATVDGLDSSLTQAYMDLNRFNELMPQLNKLDEILKERDQLLKDRQLNLEQKTFFQVLEIKDSAVKPEDKGKLYYYDAMEREHIEIGNSAAAKKLIEGHKQKAKEARKELYYFVLYPRPRKGYPTQDQEQQYKAWFAEVASSLREAQ